MLKQANLGTIKVIPVALFFEFDVFDSFACRRRMTMATPTLLDPQTKEERLNALKASPSFGGPNLADRVLVVLKMKPNEPQSMREIAKLIESRFPAYRDYKILNTERENYDFVQQVRGEVSSHRRDIANTLAAEGVELLEGNPNTLVYKTKALKALSREALAFCFWWAKHPEEAEDAHWSDDFLVRRFGATRAELTPVVGFMAHYIKNEADVEAWAKTTPQGAFFLKLWNDSGYLLDYLSKKSDEELRLIVEDISRGKPLLIFFDGSFVDADRLADLMDTLEEEKNVILQGPPGTGKTWLAKRLAHALMDADNDDTITHIQFHPGYGYEDFVRGFQPQPDGTLQLVDGPFLRAIAAAQANPEAKHFVIIEEINRGLPAQIFGEMLTLIEATKRNPDEGLRLVHARDEKEIVWVPKNLYIIGTMNVADRTLAMVDFALRRRFAFFDMAPCFNEKWKQAVIRQGISPEEAESIRQKMNQLNTLIAEDLDLGEQYAVGHSSVMPMGEVKDEKRWFGKIVRGKVLPLMTEYWHDDPDRLREVRALLMPESMTQH